MSFNFNGDTPIYLQIIEHIKIEIIRKKYLPNGKLPSVRDFSLELQVNPNTVQKALSELENMGLIYTERTNGKFVTGDESVIKELTDKTVCDMVRDFYETMGKLGLSKEEIREILRNEGKEQL